MKILIAEDDLGTQKILKKFLERFGECTVVDDGAKALAVFSQAHEEEDLFDILFLDILMPQMSGHQLLQAVREFEHERKIGTTQCVKIIVVTSLNDAENVVGAFRLGCEAYITKPIDGRQVIEEMRKLGFDV